MLWDVFCRVVDNFGDIGVCWRLATNLAQRGQQVRLWVDDARALQWMAPGATQGAVAGITVLDWQQSKHPTTLQSLPPADVWVEAFGCELAPEFIAARAYSTWGKPVWINLEYLTAEAYAERTHTLPSPVMTGPAQGWTKTFFYPGFTPGTGGLLRESDYAVRQAAFDKAAWLARVGIPWHGERLVSLFCYEPAALADLLQQLSRAPTPTQLLVTQGRAGSAVKNLCQNGLQPAWNVREQLSISYLPQLSQADFDHLLWACDVNFVRGEDSVVRALWAKKPLVWQIYPQDDNAHHDKLDAFLEMLNAPPSMRLFHHLWNGMAHGDGQKMTELPDFDAWQTSMDWACQRLLQMDDLATQLLGFVQKER